MSQRQQESTKFSYQLNGLFLGLQESTKFSYQLKGHVLELQESTKNIVYRFKKIIGNPNFSNLLKRIVNRFRRAGYSLDIMRQTACLVFNPIIVVGYAALFSCTAVVQASDSM